MKILAKADRERDLAFCPRKVPFAQSVRLRRARKDPPRPTDRHSDRINTAPLSVLGREFCNRPEGAVGNRDAIQSDILRAVVIEGPYRQRKCVS
jgi:hypothetical protein